ncbi:hypothetical protein ACP70R_032205 [Stipagrostis hirtigluma subsp. patula]
MQASAPMAAATTIVLLLTVLAGANARALPRSQAPPPDLISANASVVLEDWAPENAVTLDLDAVHNAYGDLQEGIRDA